MKRLLCGVLCLAISVASADAQEARCGAPEPTSKPEISRSIGSIMTAWHGGLPDFDEWCDATPGAYRSVPYVASRIDRVRHGRRIVLAGGAVVRATRRLDCVLRNQRVVLYRARGGWSLWIADHGTVRVHMIRRPRADEIAFAGLDEIRTVRRGRLVLEGGGVLAISRGVGAEARDWRRGDRVLVLASGRILNLSHEGETVRASWIRGNGHGPWSDWDDDGPGRGPRGGWHGDGRGDGRGPRGDDPHDGRGDRRRQVIADW